jgi:secondary thiamine-phosphate synthase enzyme
MGEMKSHFRTLSVETGRKQEILDLTSRIGDIAGACGVENGLIGVFCQHTTAGLFVGEYQEALNDDVLEFLGQAVREDLPYRHNSPEFSDCDRKNAASHIRSLLLGNGVLLPLSRCAPILGRFQSVILAELDGPRERTLQVQVFGE